MLAKFFKRGEIDMIAIRADASTTTELVATDAHKKRFEAQWIEYAGEEPAEEFNIAKASKDELEAFALDKYGIDIDKRKGVKALRLEVAALSE